MESSHSNTQRHNTQVPKAHEQKKIKNDEDKKRGGWGWRGGGWRGGGGEEKRRERMMS